ncbi:MAG: hypothetical protein RI580_18205, partial [Halothece sp. Uz-M2-17]|nr:hypothetical protein [Halothece sp. Uz-M2-17]
FGTETEPTDNGVNSPSTPEEEPVSTAEETDVAEETTATEDTVLPARGVTGLTQATDPDEFIQARGVTPGQNRGDPFTLFPVPPEGEVRLQSSDPASDGLPSLPEENAPPPPPPEPELARAVQVQGAVKIGDEVSAIVKAPNEKSSRYVRPGQLIADNQVLVKRINIDQRPNPIVILEELGIEEEVIKTVEEGMTAGSQTAPQQSAAQLPPPPPPAI